MRHYVCCFICRLRLTLGLWDHSAAKRHPRLPSSLTPITSKSTSPPTALAPTKASASTSTPEVLQPQGKKKICLKVSWKISTSNLLFHVSPAGKVCPAVVTSHSTVVPEKPEHHPGQIVKVTCELGYVLTIVSTESEH